MLWLLPLKRYVQFSGRSGRAEFWQYYAFLGVALLITLLLDYDRGGYWGVPQLSLLVLLATIVPTYAVTFRRLHDRNLSGWVIGIQSILNGIAFSVDHIRDITRGSLVDAPFALIYFSLAIATALISLYLLIQAASPGDTGDNRFGPPPSDTSDTAPKFAELMAAAAERARSLAPAPPADKLAQLERLAKLHRDGLLTDAEFEQQKAALLSQPGR